MIIRMLHKCLPLLHSLYSGAIIPVLIGFALLFSCKEIAIIDHFDDKINFSEVGINEGNLHFFLIFGSFGDDESVTSRNASNTKPETAIVPLGDDLSMIATLEPVTKENRQPSVALRVLTENARIIIVAYKEVSSVFTYEHHVGYRVAVGGDHHSSLIRDEMQTPFSLSSTDTYKFVAYSYNDDTLAYPIPPYLPDTIVDIRPGLDLLWGESIPCSISPASNNILISMKHLFSKVQIHATSEGVGNINAIEVAIRGYTADFAIEDGNLTANTDSAILFTGFANLGTSSVSSSPRIVYTAGSNPTVVDVSEVKIDGTTYQDLTTTFAKQLLEGQAYNLTMKFGKASELTDNNPAGINVFVGAFWKDSQTGERLIRIPRPANGVGEGSWSAVVIKGADWIVLDKEMSSDPNIGWLGGSANEDDVDSYENPAIDFDALHGVGGLQTAVSGVMNEGTPQIYFRIGLRTPYAPTLSAPARYGLILLTYGDNHYRQRIWVRQGEGADYLMRPGALDPGAGVPSRSLAVQFVPYNLTVAGGNLNGPVRNSYGLPPGIDPAAGFTDYPSQAGAHFQWANTGLRTRYAWDTYDAITPKPWDNTLAGNFWASLINDHEMCPYGFARPNDGSIVAASSGSIINSEIRQSLWLNPQETTGSNMVNSAWGYYADGFFDRRDIKNAGGADAGISSSVSIHDDKIAHIGRIFFNNATNASLFFPAAGYREQLTGSGAQARYLSSSRNNNSYGWNTYFSSEAARMDNPTAAPWDGFSIRCVVCVPLETVTVLASPGNTVTAGTRVTFTAHITPSTAINAHYKWQKSEDGGVTFSDITGAPDADQYKPVITLGSSIYRVEVSNCGGALYSSHTDITGFMPPDNMVDNPNIALYAGAFWRAGEKGERVVRFNVGASNLGNVGEWSVEVGQYDPQWDLTHPTNPDGIVLATGMSNDPGIYTANPSNAESYPVTGNLSGIRGNVTNNGWIEFRIGLKEPFSTGFDPVNPDYSSTFPARYATLLLLYGEKANGNAKVQKIYIRQGEGPDYVMQPADPIDVGGVNGLVSTTRPAAMRFSPYNLTMSGGTIVNNNWGQLPHLAQNGGILTDYPTKAGFMFVFPERYAISPDAPTGSFGAWNQNILKDDKGPWKTDWETCPPYYRRPHDGQNYLVANSTGGIPDSEIRQSLWVTPGVGKASNYDNSVWGYYADGYFDRRQIVNALGGTNPATLSAVATNSVQVAYKGRLFFNPSSLASLFFPSAGYRNSDNGTLNNAGENGYYRTTQVHTVINNFNMWHLYFFSNASVHDTYMEYNIKASNSSRTEGGSIRCVYDPPF